MYVVFVTFDAEEEASRVAHVLIDERKAACVSMFPVRSTYLWKGRKIEAKESLLMIKCQEKKYGELERRIRELHSAEVPEIIAVKVERGLKDYLNWVDSI